MGWTGSRMFGKLRSSRLLANAEATKAEKHMIEPIRTEARRADTVHRAPLHEVTSEGRVVVEVDTLLRSAAVRRVAELASQIVQVTHESD